MVKNNSPYKNISLSPPKTQNGLKIRQYSILSNMVKKTSVKFIFEDSKISSPDWYLCKLPSGMYWKLNKEGQQEYDLWRLARENKCYEGPLDIPPRFFKCYVAVPPLPSTPPPKITRKTPPPLPSSPPPPLPSGTKTPPELPPRPKFRKNPPPLPPRPIDTKLLEINFTELPDDIWWLIGQYDANNWKIPKCGESKARRKEIKYYCKWIRSESESVTLPGVYKFYKEHGIIPPREMNDYIQLMEDCEQDDLYEYLKWELTEQ